jgi:hypothetical protein
MELFYELPPEEFFRQLQIQMYYMPKLEEFLPKDVFNYS